MLVAAFTMTLGKSWLTRVSALSGGLLHAVLVCLVVLQLPNTADSTAGLCLMTIGDFGHPAFTSYQRKVAVGMGIRMDECQLYDTHFVMTLGDNCKYFNSCIVIFLAAVIPSLSSSSLSPRSCLHLVLASNFNSITSAFLIGVFSNLALFL